MSQQNPAHGPRVELPEPDRHRWNGLRLTPGFERIGPGRAGSPPSATACAPDRGPTVAVPSGARITLQTALAVILGFMCAIGCSARMRPGAIDIVGVRNRIVEREPAPRAAGAATRRDERRAPNEQQERRAPAGPPASAGSAVTGTGPSAVGTSGGVPAPDRPPVPTHGLGTHGGQDPAGQDTAARATGAAETEQRSASTLPLWVLALAAAALVTIALKLLR
jgi:hypothetical protein